MGHGVEAVTVSGFKSLRASISERSSAPGVASNTGEGSNTMSIRVAVMVASLSVGLSLGFSLTLDPVQKWGSESRNGIVGNTVVVK